MNTVCAFCRRIENGEYGDTLDKDVVQFVPLKPVTPGHRLFVPKFHGTDFRESPSILGITITAAANWYSELDANLIVSAGTNATQTIMHLHVHRIPRIANDGLKLPWTGQK